MSLWFISRHGEAEPNANTDFERQLTPQGKERLNALWQRIGEQTEVELPTAILASPYIRAQQTAAIIARNLSISRIETSELLVPEASVSQLLTTLSAAPAATEPLLIVSHMPFVGRLTSLWRHGIGAPAASYSVGQVRILKGDACLGGASLVGQFTQ